MKDIQNLLNKIFNHDVALLSYVDSDLKYTPQAVWRRIFDTKCMWERHLNGLEIEKLEKYIFKQTHLSKYIYHFGEGSYTIFEDNSFYFKSNGQSEVWTNVLDFVVDKIIYGYDGPLDECDHKLLNYTGYRDIAYERGMRQ